MFNKDKKPNEVSPLNQKPKDKKDEKNKNPSNNKDNPLKKSPMNSEDQKN